MVVGSIAGVAVLYELVSLAHRSQLATKLHSPTNVWLADACVFFFGWGMALAAGLHRRAPGVALLLVWLAGAYQLAFGVEIMLVELAVTVVAFGRMTRKLLVTA